MKYQFVRFKSARLTRLETTTSEPANEAGERTNNQQIGQHNSESTIGTEHAKSPHTPTANLLIPETVTPSYSDKTPSLTGINMTHILIKLKTVKRPVAPIKSKHTHRSKYSKNRRFPSYTRIIMGMLVLVILLTGGVFAYYQIEIAPSLNNILGQAAKRKNQQNTQNQTDSKFTDNRINIALFGSDTDNKFEIHNGEGYLAQTIILITIDPQSGYAGMLSIPRDMQVWDPLYGYPKLDEVFMHAFKGNTLQEKIAAAAGHTMDVIDINYGIYIDYYAWVGLQGFIKVIDTAGGINVDVIHPMLDDAYPDDINNANHYDYKRLHIAPGPQHLNGTEALEYVRTRHSDLIGDIGRTIRQQQVLDRLKAKLTTDEIINHASEYLRNLDGFLQTDMQLADIISLANYARDIDTNQMDKFTLGPPNYAYPIEGTSNFAPICEEVGQIIAQMFAIMPVCIPQQYQGDTQEPQTLNSHTSLFNHHPNQPENVYSTVGLVTSSVQGIRSLLNLMMLGTYQSLDAMML